MAAARWIARTALGLGLAYVAGVGALNAFMNWGGFERVVNGAQPDVTFVLGPSWQWVPGRVRGEDLFMQVHDPGVQMDLRIDRYEVDIDLRAFFDKTFHATRVVVDGMTIRLRATRPLEDLCAAPEGLPPIDGQSLPRGRAGGDCRAQPDTSRARGPKPGRDDVFKVNLAGVEARGIREIWIEHYRVVGDATLAGDWFFWPSYELSLHLERFDLGAARLEIAEETRIDDVGLSMRSRVEDVDLTGEGEAWSRVSFDLRVALKSIDFGLYRTLYRLIPPLGRPPLERVDGHGDLKGEFSVERGLPRHLQTTLTDSAAGVQVGPMRIGGALTFDAAAVATSTRAELRFRDSFVELRHLTVVQADREPRHYPDAVMRLELAEGSRLDPTDGRSRLHLRASSAQLQPLLDLFPKGLPKAYANVVLANDAPIAARTVVESRSGSVTLRDIDVEAKALHVTGELAVFPEMVGGLEAKVGPIKVRHEFRPPGAKHRKKKKKNKRKKKGR